jgi:hypothetical protein
MVAGTHPHRIKRRWAMRVSGLPIFHPNGRCPSRTVRRAAVTPRRGARGGQSKASGAGPPAQRRGRGCPLIVIEGESPAARRGVPGGLHAVHASTPGIHRRRDAGPAGSRAADGRRGGHRPSRSVPLLRPADQVVRLRGRRPAQVPAVREGDRPGQLRETRRRDTRPRPGPYPGDREVQGFGGPELRRTRRARSQRTRRGRRGLHGPDRRLRRGDLRPARRRQKLPGQLWRGDGRGRGRGGTRRGRQ